MTGVMQGYSGLKKEDTETEGWRSQVKLIYEALKKQVYPKVL